MKFSTFVVFLTLETFEFPLIVEKYFFKDIFSLMNYMLKIMLYTILVVLLVQPNPAS